MNAVIYVRYSCDNQREESIEGQLRECRAFSERNNSTLIDTYIDRAMSAKTDNRLEFQKMIKDSAKGDSSMRLSFGSCTDLRETDMTAHITRLCFAKMVSSSYLRQRSFLRAQKELSLNPFWKDMRNIIWQSFRKRLLGV